MLVFVAALDTLRARIVNIGMFEIPFLKVLNNMSSIYHICKVVYCMCSSYKCKVFRINILSAANIRKRVNFDSVKGRFSGIREG